MKDRFFKYFEVLIKYPKILIAVLGLLGASGSGVFGVWMTDNAYAEELKEVAKSLTAEQGALKIYADMAYNCPNIENPPTIRHNDTRYIELLHKFEDHEH